VIIGFANLFSIIHQITAHIKINKTLPYALHCTSAASISRIDKTANIARVNVPRSATVFKIDHKRDTLEVIFHKDRILSIDDIINIVIHITVQV
jgi:hypothetical protein